MVIPFPVSSSFQGPLRIRRRAPLPARFVARDCNPAGAVASAARESGGTNEAPDSIPPGILPAAANRRKETRMLVANRMSARVVTIEPQQSLEQARTLLLKHKVRQLPVLKQKKLVGILTDRDLRSAPTTAKLVGEVMTPKPLFVGSAASVDEAARLIRLHRIGALPVVDDGRLVGILSATDVLDAFIDLSGVGDYTYRIALSNAKGRQAQQKVRQIVLDRGRGELKWLHADTKNPNKLHLRLKARRVDDVVTALEAAGFDVDAVVAPAKSRA